MNVFYFQINLQKRCQFQSLSLWEQSGKWQYIRMLAPGEIHPGNSGFKSPVAGEREMLNTPDSCEENLTVPQEPGFTSQLTAGFKTFKLGQLLRNILFARVTKDKRNSWQLLNQRKLILVCIRFTGAPLHYSVLCPMYQSRKFCQCHSEIIIK